MRKLLIIFIGITAFGQSNLDKETAKIVDEGKMLYNSEMASWYGTDIFIELYKNSENIGGYFSYTDNDVPKCIFFSKDKKPKVIGTINFEPKIKLETAKADLKEREFTKNELDYYELRKEAMNIIYSDTILNIIIIRVLMLFQLLIKKKKKYSF